MTFAKVAFVNKENGMRVDGEMVADTGYSWLVKPSGKPVLTLTKSEWDSAAPKRDSFEDIFSMFR